MLILMSNTLVSSNTIVSLTVNPPSASTDEVTVYSWPKYQNYLNNTGYTESPAPRTNTVIWNVSVGSVPCGGPTVANGIVYTAGTTENPTTHNVYALNMTTGEKLWNYTVSQIVRSALAVADGTVYFGSENGILYALDAATGALKWTYPTGNTIARSHPSVANGIVYIGSYTGYVYAINAATGQEVWKYDTGDKVRGCPAVVDGTVYVGSASDTMYALDAATGALKWSFLTSPAGDIRCSPAVADGKVYFGNQDDQVFCLDATTGQKIWNYTTGGDVFSSPAVAYGLVYIGSDDYTVYALNMTTGKQVWNYTMDGRAAYASPVVADGLLFMGDYDTGTVYCLNATTGQEVWKLPMGGSIRGPTPVVDGILFAGTFKVNIGGELCAIGTLPGAPTQPQAPTASFTFSPLRPKPDEDITFDASDSTDLDGTIVSYTWDFGDGNVTTVTVPTIIHSFPEGTYQVTLTVKDDANLTDSETKQVTVRPGIPIIYIAIGVGVAIAVVIVLVVVLTRKKK
jgi:outer membrane protein assembly factor BamB